VSGPTPDDKRVGADDHCCVHDGGMRPTDVEPCCPECEGIVCVNCTPDTARDIERAAGGRLRLFTQEAMFNQLERFQGLSVSQGKQGQRGGVCRTSPNRHPDAPTSGCSESEEAQVERFVRTRDRDES